MLQEVEGEELPEVAWLLHRSCWGHGYATEAAAATRDAAFTRWQYEAMISLIRPENVASQKVAQRIGMQPGRLVEFQGFQHIVFQVGASAGHAA
jgi:RimJ/RimL family protein N-acetyltransferase